MVHPLPADRSLNQSDRTPSCCAAALACARAFTATIARASDPLPSWNEGKAKHSILEFVAKVTKEGGPDFLPPARARVSPSTSVSMKDDWKRIFP
jgi:hypothetical protein